MFYVVEQGEPAAASRRAQSGGDAGVRADRCRRSSACDRFAFEAPRLLMINAAATVEYFLARPCWRRFRKRSRRLNRATNADCD